MSGGFGLIITFEMAKKKPVIYTVSQVNSLIRAILEDNLPGRFAVTGEITDWKRNQSGHCYFSLKDKGSKLPCVMWKSRFSKVKFSPENGIAVLATGFVDVYVPHGRYQFVAERLEPAGIGALQLAFEQMVKKLEAQGLFDDAGKKPLPAYPQRIGILTSESGAAIGDITDSIQSRWPCVRLFLYPVPVQGEGAAGEIAAGLKDVNKRNRRLKLDVVIVGRGGGSLEDLWAFNEEVLARAIFDSAIPVISAVGHEVDTTIADLVADARASTPTKAGAVAVPDIQEVLGQLAYFEKSLVSKTRWKLEFCQQGLARVLASAVFRNPLLAVRNREQQLDELAARLNSSARELIAAARARLSGDYEKIVSIEPHRLLGKKTVELNELKNRIDNATRAVINRCRMRLTSQTGRLAGLNPKSVLQRGYSITTNKRSGALIRNLDDVQRGDLLATELADENLIESKVTKKQKRTKNR